MRRLLRLLVVVAALSLPACRAPSPVPPHVLPDPLSEEEPPARVLIIHEETAENHLESASALATLIAHFDERCEILAAGEYTADALGRFRFAFFLAGPQATQARPLFVADLTGFEGTVVWVGPGVESLGKARLDEMGIAAPGDGGAAAVGEWALSYGGQRHVEMLGAPPVRAAPGRPALAEATRGSERRAFLAGAGRAWYAAAAPSLREEHFWSACVWADALHEILGMPHKGEPRRLFAALRDVPVWTTAAQVPRAILPVIEAGVPVTVLASTRTGDVALADRPEAVRGLRKAEALGATLTLSAAAPIDALREFRLAWEVGLHPVAWCGPSEPGAPFGLRIADRSCSPPFCAGGLLPAPIPVSDAGYVAPRDLQRLRMLEVVRDGVAVASFGLWAPPGPFLDFAAAARRGGWQLSDLRDVGVRVMDPRRVIVSGRATLRLPERTALGIEVLGPTWSPTGPQSRLLPAASPKSIEVTAPARSVVVVGPARADAPPVIRGVTLDPWAYVKSGMDAKTLADTLASTYAAAGVNSVFVYAYNVVDGAAYRTRYRGATVSDWGRQDLLGHLLEACHARNIRVIAWLYSGRDHGMWTAHPEWRERTRSGKEYNPLRLHAADFLCPRNPQVRQWYAGLLGDLARRYPSLDGIELCEPVVNWFGDQACYCETCNRQFAAAHAGEELGGEAWRRFRAEGLTEFLSACVEAIAREGVESYIMTISDAWSNGAILTADRQAAESGFDLDAILDGPHPPDWVNFEVIWQQWAALYGDEVFNYDWAQETATRLMRRTDGRARVCFHVELTDFGGRHMTPEMVAETVARVAEARPEGIECYHSGALDRLRGWGVLKKAYEALQ